ncbi:MAG: RHS repeat-associated core domain-containing protein [Verrucomicrobiota bacterium]
MASASFTICGSPKGSRDNESMSTGLLPVSKRRNIGPVKETLPASSYSCCFDSQERRPGRCACRRPGRSRSIFRKVGSSRIGLHLTRIQAHREKSRTCFEGPFGEVIRATGPMAKAIPFRFSTKYQDDETDLLYYGYRYYSASTGRWLNCDPLADRAFAMLITTSNSRASGGRMGTTVQRPRVELLNLFSFVFNQVTGSIDPLGLAACSECSRADIQNKAVYMGLMFNLRTKEHGREFGGVLCCDESTRTVYAGAVVEASKEQPGQPNIANSKCKKCDKRVGDWHTHPRGSPRQRGKPSETSFDLGSIIGTAKVLQCEDYIGYMTNSDNETTTLDKEENETVVDVQRN